MEEKITRRIRVKKNYFLKGRFSVHMTKYRDGQMVYDSVLNHFKKRKDAETLRKDFKKGKEVKLAYPNITYKEFISR